MALISLGDMAQTFTLRRMTTGLKQDARVAAQELTTGRTANVAQKIRGDFSNLTGVEAALSRLQGYRVATDSADLKANAMQTVFSSVDKMTDGLATSLLGAAMAGNGSNLAAFTQGASQRLETVIAALNSKIGDETLFAGVASDGPATASADTIMAALESSIIAAGATTATDIEAAVDAWFQSPTGYATTGYLGGSGKTGLAVSAEATVDQGITAADPALRDTIKALSLVALIDRGTLIPNTQTAIGLAQKAGTSLLQAQSDRTVLAGRLGGVQAVIDQAQTRNSAEESALNLARSDLLSVDPYEAATRMEAAQNQLETLYAVTARLSRLSLVDFLR